MLYYYSTPFPRPPRSHYEIHRERTLHQILLLKDLHWPREAFSFPGGFFFSLRQRFLFLWAEEKLHLQRFLYRYDPAEGFRRRVLLRWLLWWALLLAPLYFFCLLLLYLLWRIPLYLLLPIEALFENWLFLRFQEKDLPRLGLFYRSFIQPLKIFFRAYWGLLFFFHLYQLDWNRPVFWRILYDYFLKEPLLQRLYKRGWRFLRSVEILELELELDGWGPLLRRIFRPVTRPVVRFCYRLKLRIKWWRFLLLTPRGRHLFKLFRRRAYFIRLGESRRWRLERSLSWRRRLLRGQIFLLDSRSRLHLACRVFRAQPVTCCILGFFYVVAGIFFLLELCFLLLTRWWAGEGLIFRWCYHLQKARRPH